MDREERKERIVNLIRGGKRIIAIDGRCAGGKSTLALDCSKEIEVNIVRMDDFFLPPYLRTPERFASVGGNVHYERFMDEVIKGLESGMDFSYRVFSCSKMDYDGERRVLASLPTIVEGSYALHTAFPVYWDRAFFLDVDEKEQLRRLEKRCPEKLEAFKTKWIPLEEAYFSSQKIKERADEVI